MAIAHMHQSRHQWPSNYEHEYTVRDNSVLRRVIFHRFTVADVDDPQLYAAEPIHAWEKSDKGQWCKKHCVGDIVFQSTIDYHVYGHRFIIFGYLTDEDTTLFKLKWG